MSLLIASVLVLGACGGDDKKDTASNTSESTQSTTQATTGTTGNGGGPKKDSKGSGGGPKRSEGKGSSTSGGGSTQTQTTATTQTETPTQTVPKPSDVKPFNIAKKVCGSFLPLTVSRQIKNGKTTKKKVAKQYSRGYPADQRTEAYKGCLAGLNASQ